MKKKLLTLSMLALALGLQAQVLTHVDESATVYVSKSTLVYNGGGLQTKSDGKIENHGNIMVVGNNSTDVLKTIVSGGSGSDKTDGGNIINKLNEPNAYSTHNSSSNGIVYTYGQLYISGVPQSNLTAIVDQEYRQSRHGDYQQIGLPFYGKTLSTLSGAAELNKTFTNTRGSKNEILRWNNSKVRFDNVDISSTTATGTNYYILGSTGLDTSSKVFTLKGKPVAEDNAPDVTLHGAGEGIDFGVGGHNVNYYGEKYNTYLQDSFHLGAGGTVWDGNFGKNIYQFGNPFMTNLDLSKIAVVNDNGTDATNSDGIHLENIYGIRFELSGVQYSPTAGGGSTSFKYVTFDIDILNNPIPVGDVEYMMVRPFGTFVIKLKDNTKSNVLNFKNLRRFGYLARTNWSVPNSVTTNKSSATVGTVKQLGVIGLGVDGNEVQRTYYVVSPNAVTGHSTNSTAQIINSSGTFLGTFEEDPVNGGYDNNYTGSYWLYINEANETDFKGKNIKLVNYDLNKIKSYKFEIRENAQLISDGAHILSSGIGFYYKGPDGILKEAKQGDVVTALGAEYDLYYGAPDGILATTNNGAVPSRTKVVYNPAIEDYVVIFDPNWKTADIDVYDMSGKLVVSSGRVKTDGNYTIKLNSGMKSSYVVKIIADNGEKVTTKILK